MKEKTESGPALSTLTMMMTVADVAKHLNVSARFVYKLSETGKIVCYKIGSAKRFRQEDVEAFLESCRGHAAPSAQERPTTLRRLRV